MEARHVLNIAVAYDEAFHCYFPDTLDLLENHGAVIRDFSPLRSDRLPARTDLVYLGCGNADRFAAALAENHCIKQALRSHVRRGGRVYAEGSGLAYLMERMNLPDGRQLPMSGLLPLVATYKPAAVATRPISVTLIRDNWLGRTAAKLRGYLNPNWRIDAADRKVGERTDHVRVMELVGRHQVVGSRLNIDFAAQPQFLHNFFHPVPAPKQSDTAKIVSGQVTLVP
jgi:cobyrinic acid a,c-diamide synthase